MQGKIPVYTMKAMGHRTPPAPRKSKEFDRKDFFLKKRFYYYKECLHFVQKDYMLDPLIHGKE